MHRQRGEQQDQVLHDRAHTASLHQPRQGPHGGAGQVQLEAVCPRCRVIQGGRPSRGGCQGESSRAAYQVMEAVNVSLIEWQTKSWRLSW